MTEKMNDGWIEWHGGQCPVVGMEPGSVEARFRDGNENVLMFEAYYSCAALWEHTEPGSNDSNIIAYRIIADQEALPTEGKIPDRHELQKDGKHPAPCAKFCESTAYESQIRRLNNEASRLAEEINQQAIKMAAVERQRDELLDAIEQLFSLHEQEGRFQPSHFKPILKIAKDAIEKANAGAA